MRRTVFILVWLATAVSPSWGQPNYDWGPPSNWAVDRWEAVQGSTTSYWREFQLNGKTAKVIYNAKNPKSGQARPSEEDLADQYTVQVEGGEIKKFRSWELAQKELTDLTSSEPVKPSKMKVAPVSTTIRLEVKPAVRRTVPPPPPRKPVPDGVTRTWTDVVATWPKSEDKKESVLNLGDVPGKGPIEVSFNASRRQGQRFQVKVGDRVSSFSTYGEAQKNLMGQIGSAQVNVDLDGYFPELRSHEAEARANKQVKAAEELFDKADTLLDLTQEGSDEERALVEQGKAADRIKELATKKLNDAREAISNIEKCIWDRTKPMRLFLPSCGNMVTCAGEAVCTLQTTVRRVDGVHLQAGCTWSGDVCPEDPKVCIQQEGSVVPGDRLFDLQARAGGKSSRTLRGLVDQEKNKTAPAADGPMGDPR